MIAIFQSCLLPKMRLSVVLEGRYTGYKSGFVVKKIRVRMKIIINILRAVLLNLKFYFVFLYTVDLNPANVAIGGVLLLIFAVFAIIANVIIIAIYTRKNMRSPINTILTGKYF